MNTSTKCLLDCNNALVDDLWLIMVFFQVCENCCLKLAYGFFFFFFFLVCENCCLKLGYGFLLNVVGCCFDLGVVGCWVLLYLHKVVDGCYGIKRKVG